MRQRSVQFRGSEIFDQEIRRIHASLNQYVQSRGVHKRITIPQTLDLIFADGKIKIEPENLIRKKRVKKLIFRGEINL